MTENQCVMGQQEALNEANSSVNFWAVHSRQHRQRYMDIDAGGSSGTGAIIVGKMLSEQLRPLS